MKTIIEIKEQLIRRYPLPIASIYNRYICMDENDLGGRHKLLIDLFEGLSKMLCVIALKEVLANVPDFKEQLPQKEKSLDFLKHPSLGGFVSLLRELTK